MVFIYSTSLNGTSLSGKKERQGCLPDEHLDHKEMTSQLLFLKIIILNDFDLLKTFGLRIPLTFFMR